jgi:hypothetical protein
MRLSVAPLVAVIALAGCGGDGDSPRDAADDRPTVPTETDAKDSADDLIRERLAEAEQALRTDPSNEAALGDLVRGHYQLAVQQSDPQTGEVPDEARSDLEAATDAWKRYLAAADDPDEALARIALQAYESLGRLIDDPQERQPLWEDAAEAAEVVATKGNQVQGYLSLVQYASLAGQTRKADLAGQKAIALAPKDQRNQVRRFVEQAKAAAASQRGP